MKKENKQKKVLLALEEQKWINTPVIYTTFGSNFSKIQQDLMLMVSGQLQKYINKFLDEGGYKNKCRPNPMLSKDIVRAMDPIHIDLCRFDIGDNNYSYFNSVLNAIRELWGKAPAFDKYTGLKTGDNIFPIFKNVHIPASEYNQEGGSLMYKDTNGNIIKGAKRSLGYIELTLNEEVAPYVFDMHDGYFNHLERIVLYCKSKFTSRLYLLLMKHVSLGNMSPVIPFDEIKEFLGVIERDPKTGDIIKIAYTKYSQFAKLVLNVAMKDMAKMSKEHRIEIELDTKRADDGYEPIYRSASKRGNPDAIRFYIKRSELGIARDVEIHRASGEKHLVKTLISRYPTLDEGVLTAVIKDVPDNRWIVFRDYAYTQLPRVVEHPHRWYGTVESYIIYLLRNKIKELYDIKENEEEEGVNLSSAAGVPEDDIPNKVKKEDNYKIEGQFREEWTKFMATYDGTLAPLLSKAVHRGSDRGFPWIEFPDRASLDAYEKAEADPKNAEEIKRMHDILASICHIKTPVVIIVRGLMQ